MAFSSNEVRTVVTTMSIGPRCSTAARIDSWPAVPQTLRCVMPQRA
jgi:hypothetical protein